MLQIRGSLYYSRLVIPRRLQGRIGRVEITKSLRTRDIRTARSRLMLWEGRIGQLYAHVRKQGSWMNREQLDALTKKYLEASFDEVENDLALDWSPIGLEEYSSKLADECQAISAGLASADLERTIGLAQRMAPEAGELDQRKLARRLMEVQMESKHAFIKAASGERLKRPKVKSADPEEAPTTPKPTPKVSELAALYSEERITQGNWKPKTAKQSHGIYQVVCDLLGDPEIGSVTKPQIRQLGLDLAKYPSNATKRFGRLNAKTLLDQLEGQQYEALDARSINKYRQAARSLFSWAALNDYIDKNPAEVLGDVKEGRAQDARIAFDDADVATIFQYLHTRKNEPYVLWIPRIMAMTGCRMGEAAKLRRQDIKQVKGTWVFDINEEGEQQSLKTEQSIRQVPIHPRLLELGFIDWVNAETDEYLFPLRVRYTPNPERSDTDVLSKDLNRWLRQAGIKDTRKAFQSFRSTFITRLKNAATPEYQIAQIVGHENDNLTTGRYGMDVNLKALLAEIEKVSLPIS